jgi:hypothetical protein
MRRAFFFIVVVCLATPSFASIPRASAPDLSSPSFDALPETRIRVSDDLAPFERPAPSLLSRALHQGYEQASTTNASGLAGFLSVDPVLDLKRTLPEPQRWNRYTYVVNNPINRIDPDGRMDGNGMGEPLEWICSGCTRAEQLAQSNRIAKGTAIGAAVSLAIMAGPSGWRALGAAAMNWVRGNPGAVQQATQAIGGLAPGPSSPFASGSITMASGMVKSGGKLAGVLGAIEQGAAGARPGTANAAMEIVQSAVTSQGLEAGVAIKAAPGAAITLQNVGNVTTSIYESGRIVVKQGEKVVLDLIQKAQ